ncbi:histidine--tRNA ligase [Candidatus Tremblaya phenacola]|uniref:Histidine--tRNA ligase n=1 Tax=Candidatus Tremblayella phenacoccinincola TaxID=1010676 RepID=A0A2G0V706_9PROT|nr:histidine--tRNA ligase [Candidatus Tremblaya phenacola]PHN16255.1 Histidine--tRNA ligase [Candidatus Tremblaya phenacola]
MKSYISTQPILWQPIEEKLLKLITNYSYKEVRLPIIEHTSLFKKAIGRTTDIIRKELFNYADKKGKGFTLRPEGTTGCVRAGIELGLIHNQEQRSWYIGSMFRHDRPQKGRYRQFNQLGIECFGLKEPELDAELIILTKNIWTTLGITNYLSLELNSIGSIEERETYNKTLAIFFSNTIKALDKASSSKLVKDPFRLLDSKEYVIKKIVKTAPTIYSYLSDSSKRLFNSLCLLLDINGVKYKLNNFLVRGLDYYNNTVFEWVEANNIKSQATICGGGRYDNLVEKLGGFSTPAIGCALGLERLAILIDNNLKQDNKLDTYIIPTYIEANVKAMVVSETIRTNLTKLRSLTSYEEGSFKRKLINPYNHNSKLVIIIETGKYIEEVIVIKALINGNQYIIPKDTIVNEVNKAIHLN